MMNQDGQIRVGWLKLVEVVSHGREGRGFWIPRRSSFAQVGLELIQNKTKQSKAKHELATYRI
jgi:hypothetical protein